MDLQVPSKTLRIYSIPLLHISKPTQIKSDPLRHLRIGICLLMFPNHTNIPTLRLLNLSPKQSQPLPNMNNLTNKPHFSSCRYRPQISHFEIATNTTERELPRLGNAQQDSR